MAPNLAGDGMMVAMSAAIAVSGATGQLGGRVATLLADRGVSQRLIVRDPRRAPALDGAEIAVAEFGDDSLREALTGIETFFMVSASETAGRSDLHAGAVNRAVEAGVRRIVYVSFCAAAPDCTFTFGRDHWHTEQHISASGLAYTFLRDNLYLDMMPLFVGADGTIRGPAGDGRVAAVARDDIAEVAAKVLVTDEFDGQGLELTGPNAFTLSEAAAAMTEAFGRPISYHAESVAEAYASRSSYGAPQWEVEGWVTSYTAIAAGELEHVSDVVPRLLGRPATSLTQYVGRLSGTPS
jgi:NAD(P)H dehydrogenase (quinone)